jgi:hypothetical protein
LSGFQDFSGTHADAAIKVYGAATVSDNVTMGSYGYAANLLTAGGAFGANQFASGVTGTTIINGVAQPASTAWAPHPLFGSTAPSSYTSSGTWYQAGPLVFVQGTITFTTLGTPAGALSINNLPVSALAGSQASMTIYQYNNAGAPSGAPTNPLLPGSLSGTSVSIYSQSPNSLVYGNFANGGVLNFSGFYFAE